ncbi:MAG: TolC family protein [Candidatus Brocadiia bacterium]|nr:MAG: TolC family protein [Candidatus Brocadiia bacterium]
MLKSRFPVFLYLVFCAAIAVGVVGGCSTAHYKAQADKEVYGIINSKWDESIGRKANYTISDVAPSPNDLSFDKDMLPAGPLTLAQAVAIATANNRDYQQQKENLYLSALDLSLVRHRFARQWFGTVDAGYARGSEDEAVNAGTRTGFDQLLTTGGSISADIAIDWMQFLTGDPRTSLGSVLNASFTQPLLGNGRKAANETLTQAERSFLYQIRTVNRYRQTFVVSVVTEYYQVLQEKNRVLNAQNNYQRVSDSKKRLEAEAGVGRRPKFEVDQAEQDVLSSNDSLVGTMQSYQQKLDEFKINMALPTDAQIELDPNELEALSKIGISEPEYSERDAIETGLVRRLDLATAADKIDDSARKVIVAEDNLGLGLTLSGGAGVKSTKDTDFSRLQFHNGTYGLGLGADLPFDRKSERTAYREKLINLQQSQREYEDSIAQTKLQIRLAYRQVIESAESYRIQQKSLDLARKRVESTSLFLKAGRAQTRDLLDSQNALLEAENQLTDALVRHMVAKLNFFRDIGVLNVRPDGMWDK